MDLYISTVGGGGAVPSYRLLELGNQVVDGWYYPRAQAVGINGSSISGEFTLIPVYDYIKVELESADVGDTVDVWFMLSPGA
jgi:hypothetical protein